MDSGNVKLKPRVCFNRLMIFTERLRGAMILLPIYKKKELYQVNPTKIIALGLNYREHIAESDSIKVRGLAQNTD